MQMKRLRRNKAARDANVGDSPYDVCGHIA